MRGRLLMVGALLSGAIWAQSDDLRVKLTGKWQQQGDGTVAVWEFRDTGDAMHIVRYEGTQTATEFECSTLGKECSVKDGGRPAKVTLYFNGPKLVELEVRGKETLKRRFGVTGSGDLMDLEVIPLVPEGKTEVLHFHRVEEAKR